ADRVTGGAAEVDRADGPPAAVQADHIPSHDVGPEIGEMPDTVGDDAAGPIAAVGPAPADHAGPVGVNGGVAGPGVGGPIELPQAIGGRAVGVAVVVVIAEIVLPGF